MFSITYHSTPEVSTIYGGTTTLLLPSYSVYAQPPSGNYNIFGGDLTFNFTQCITLPSSTSSVSISFLPGSVGDPGSQSQMYLLSNRLDVVKLS